MNRRKLTPGYIIFYLLFWPDTWCIVLGIAFAAVVGPAIIPDDLGVAGSWLLYIMLATIGYRITAPVGRGISRWLRKLILGNRATR